MSRGVRFLVDGLIVLGIFLIIGLIGGLEHRYTVKAEVSNIHKDTVYFTDIRGHIWSQNCDNKTYEVGETVTLVMHDGVTTSNVHDDYILKVKK
jgi:hypothetical protein